MNKSLVLIFVLVFIAASFMVTIQAIKADSRTIVVPDDYSTIAAAIEHATDGDVILVRKGTYDGPLNQTLMVNKTISLIGEDANSTILRLHPAMYEWFIGPVSMGWTWRDSLQVFASDVTISGFTIESDGGTILANGNRIQVVNNIITADLTMNGSFQTCAQNVLTTRMVMRGSYQTCAYNVLTVSFFSNGTVISYGEVVAAGTYGRVIANDLVNGTIGISGHYNTISANNGIGGIGSGGEASHNFIYANTLRDSGGIFIAGIADTVANNTITNSVWFGVQIVWGNGNIVQGNIIRNCAPVGLYETDNSGGDIFYANNVTDCSCGAKIVGWHSNGTVLYCNNFVNNTQQVNTDANETDWDNFTRQLYHGGSFDNQTIGNFWSDYKGTDADADGVGDTPYVIDASRSDHYPLTAPFNVSSVTIQIPEWANITSPNSISTPSFPPSPAPSPSPTPSPSPSPSPTPVIPETTPLAALVTLVVVTCTVATAIRKKFFAHSN